MLRLWQSNCLGLYLSPATYQLCTLGKSLISLNFIHIIHIMGMMGVR